MQSRRPGWPGVEDVVVGYRSVTVVADPVAVDLDAWRDALGQLSRRRQAGPVEVTVRSAPSP